MDLPFKSLEFTSPRGEKVSLHLYFTITFPILKYRSDQKQTKQYPCSHFVESVNRGQQYLSGTLAHVSSCSAEKTLRGVSRQIVHCVENIWSGSEVEKQKYSNSYLV